MLGSEEYTIRFRISFHSFITDGDGKVDVRTSQTQIGTSPFIPNLGTGWR
jgi:hypothetical protein